MKYLGPVFALLSLASLAAACGREESPGASSTAEGSRGRGGTAGAVAGASGTGGRGGPGGSGGGEPTSPTPDAGSVPNPDSGTTEDASGSLPGTGAVAPDASTGRADGFASSEVGATPMTTDGGSPPSYEGEI